jgi:hypothetical protein
MRVLSTIIAASLLTAACATQGADVPRAEAVEAPTYKVIKADADIPFANRSVRGFTVTKDDTLILESTGGRFFKVEVWSPCQRDLPFAHAIGLDTRGGGRLDRFSQIVIGRQRCPIQSLDEIENPRVTAAAAKAATAPAT